MYFEFANFIYVASYKKQIIVLNILNNQYLSLGKKAGSFLPSIISNYFEFENNVYFTTHQDKEMSDIDFYIKLFLDKKIIEKTLSVDRRNRIAIPEEEIGLNKLDWMPTHQHKGIKHSFFELSMALVRLMKIHYVIKKHALQGLITLLTKKREIIINEEKEDEATVKKIAYILDKACMYYPKKTLCLPWASTFAYLLQKSNIPFKFFIGVQTEPFYAHAWVEYNGEVINDNPQVKKRLAPIFSISFT